jgi:hypothetical protein
MTSSVANPSESELSSFLRSPLWEERHQMPLSVLSALARLDVDPWEHAAGLARLPPDDAARDLRLILARLPGAAGCAEFDAICRRAVHLLPRAAVPTTSGVRARSGVTATSMQSAQTRCLPLLLWMVVISLMASQFLARQSGPGAPAAQAAEKPAHGAPAAGSARSHPAR